MICNVFVRAFHLHCHQLVSISLVELSMQPSACLSFLLLDVSAHQAKQTERRMKSQCKGYALIGLIGELCERQAEIIGSVKNIEEREEEQKSERLM